MFTLSAHERDAGVTFESAVESYDEVMDTALLSSGTFREFGLDVYADPPAECPSVSVLVPPDVPAGAVSAGLSAAA
jgi:hypothetical protein